MRTSFTVAPVSVQSAAVLRFCASFAQTDFRMSAVGGEYRSAFPRSERSASIPGELESSARPTTSMLLPGTLFTITPGARTSLAE